MGCSVRGTSAETLVNMGRNRANSWVGGNELERRRNDNAREARSQEKEEQSGGADLLSKRNIFQPESRKGRECRLCAPGVDLGLGEAGILQQFPFVSEE